jgi:hypothetical protein
MKTNKMEKGKRQFLVVSTDKRGVFGGYGVPTQNTVITLEEAQMCVHWDAATKGFTGLAADGPTKGCRIGPPAPAITLQGVVSVMQASSKAEAAWKSQPWA